MSEYFIFTEAYNCADILKNCLKSFYRYHNDIVYVYGTESDFEELKDFPLIKKIVITPNSPIDMFYTNGHMGTAAIFSDAILNNSTSNKIIHFDSDLIFRQECLSQIKEKLDEGFDLVGPTRPYKHNLNGRDDIRHLPDVVATCFFGFNKDKINILNYNELTSSINGRDFFNHATLDFFDYISFLIAYNGGKIHYFDHNHVGGPNTLGNRDNKYGKINHDIDHGDWFTHFAGIGSGARIYKKGFQNCNKSYGEWALKRYAMYKKLFENLNIPNINIDEEYYNLYKKYF
jgi:hypothetical protein